MSEKDIYQLQIGASGCYYQPLLIANSCGCTDAQPAPRSETRGSKFILIRSIHPVKYVHMNFTGQADLEIVVSGIAEAS